MNSGSLAPKSLTKRSYQFSCSHCTWACICFLYKLESVTYLKRKMSPIMWIHQDTRFALGNMLHPHWERLACAGKWFQSRSPTPGLSGWPPNILKAQQFLRLLPLSPWSKAPPSGVDVTAPEMLLPVPSPVISRAAGSHVYFFHSEQKTKSFQEPV